MELTDGRIIPANTYHPSQIEHPGLTLINIVDALSNTTKLFNDLGINFYHYLNEAYIDT